MHFSFEIEFINGKKLISLFMKTATEIKKEIIRALKQYPVVNSSKIKIDIIGDVVWLSGKVDCYYKKFVIREAAKNIAGIKYFHIDVCVELPKQKQLSDKEIKNAILNTVITEVPDSKISVSVTDGIVTLTGTLFSNEQKNMVLKSVAGAPGILNVWDFIKIKTGSTNSGKGYHNSGSEKAKVRQVVTL